MAASVSQAAISEGPASASAEDTFLVGQVGKDYIQNTLSTNSAPLAAINEIQARGSLRDPRCRPLLGLLDQLGTSRSESHKYVVDQSTALLLEKIPSLSPELLLRLLEKTFPYIGILELRCIPLAVLEHLRPVPLTFLKQLASDRELFWELPPQVQRQVFELDKQVLQYHADALIHAYASETATALQSLNMDAFMPHHVDSTAENPLSMQQQQQHESLGTSLPSLARRNLRKGSAALNKLTFMVGESKIIYRGIIDLCVAQYRNAEVPYLGMKESALCTLRSQLLMALHDAGTTSLCSGDPCYKLAWTLDACVKEKEIDSRRMNELSYFFNPYVETEEMMDARKMRSSGGAGQTGKAGLGNRDDDAESAGVPGAALIEDPFRHLGDAGMMLKDPASFYLVIVQIIRCLQKCVKNQIVPKEEPDLKFLTKLVRLAVSCCYMLKSDEFEFAEPFADLITVFYPLLADVMLDAELRKEEHAMNLDATGTGTASTNEDMSLYELTPPDELHRSMVRNETSRYVVLMYALERLACGDLVTARIILVAVALCLENSQAKAIIEFAPFGFTLARRVATLLSTGTITASHPIWYVAVDKILLILVDSETRVHEEVLRLLLTAMPQLTSSRLASYIECALQNSKRSRDAHTRQWRDLRSGGASLSNYDGDDGGWSPNDGMHERRWRGSGGADGVRGTYKLFGSAKYSKLNRYNAPALYEYLDATR